ncbi:MAG: DNA gyrase inhibitor YacG [Casimicrobium sp.]
MTVVRCPRCEIDVEWKPENKFRPFCSERCKLMDLGAWANEEYRVPGSAQDPANPQFNDPDQP